MKASMFDMLDYGAIIFADEEYGICVTWNGSATFNWWVNQFDGTWANMDVRTVYDITSLRDAEKIAEEWLKDVEAEVEAEDED